MTPASHKPTLFQQGPGVQLPPLASRMRPTSLNDFVGQDDLMGPGRLLEKALSMGQLFSMILWGPPGSGKTTLARLLARHSEAAFYDLTAVSAGVKDVRAVLEAAASNRDLGRPTLLFIDEIHRFNKAQQDALLPAVEDGTVVLVGATTENPSFEVISPLLSRCRVIRLQPYTDAQLAAMLDRALAEDILLARLEIKLSNEVRTLLTSSAGGDARKLFNALEIAVGRHGQEPAFTLSTEDLQEALQQRGLLYDRAGDYHFDTISAFIKSVRGSDPDAAVYWLAIMLEGGEKPEFVARRLVILASEDIGNADPQALVMATAGMQAVHMVGMPEGGLVLAQVSTYLAAAPKSNAAYQALNAATRRVKADGAQTVPLHLRNAVTGLMASLNYGKDYAYPHDDPEHFVPARYLPDGMTLTEPFYRPGQQGHEKFIRQRLEKLWPGRY
ncbi:MAG: replication-associated recombination protein A [Candidatus Marinimicrobia bacterium]|nr:replication-associated recombination protein A [Candidatus Neomarinimicrobiota bacterium]